MSDKHDPDKGSPRKEIQNPPSQNKNQLGLNRLSPAAQTTSDDAIQDTKIDPPVQTEPPTPPGASQPDVAAEGDVLNPPIRAAQVDPDEGAPLLSPGQPGADEVYYVKYSSHPIMNYRIGNDYVFEKGILRLLPQDEARFKEVMSKQPIQIQNEVRPLSEAMANDWIAEVQSRKVAGIDTTANSMGPGATDGAFGRR